MWIDQLLASPTTRATELAAAFAEQRHRVLAENLANIDTPDYHTRSLDPRAFQAALRAALERAPQADQRARLDLRGDAQVVTDAAGRLSVRPDVQPAPNVLFHDGTNARLEKLLADINENAVHYEMSVNFLRGRYQMLLSAIRGRMT